MQAGWQQEMANSSSNVVREGDEGLQRKSQRIFCVQRGGARLVLYCMPDQGADQKKRRARGTPARSPGGGMMMLDGCAGLGEHGRKKDKSK